MLQKVTDENLLQVFIEDFAEKLEKKFLEIIQSSTYTLGFKKIISQ